MHSTKFFLYGGLTTPKTILVASRALQNNSLQAVLLRASSTVEIRDAKVYFCKGFEIS